MERDDLDFIVLKHFVQRKNIELEWNYDMIWYDMIVVYRRINVFQEKQIEVQVVSQEAVDGEVGAY